MYLKMKAQLGFHSDVTRTKNNTNFLYDATFLNIALLQNVLVKKMCLCNWNIGEF
jgi:hypothetical protein